ncbi:zinc ribbon domain-containing protein [Halobacterium litoreum]|uniref:Zinc ribbon domain-containing protein n=1 Tax=Halobacterium litoreum TaxID=2039234 RepID=A0ABD5NFY5_9EURY|nr:zinc ribbon domain-containing protein [Halobacterium litoreum]UHH12960.1 zinc ribbon domain-containing protein [Halobacterium litoreum]
MYCTDCGAAVGDDAAFCTECGAAVDGAAGQDSAGTAERNPQRDGRETDSGWATSRLLAAGGGALAGVSLFLPWVTAVRGSFSADGMATEFAPVLMAGVAAALVFAGVSWGRGWGWLSMILTGLAGAGIAAVAFVFRATISETTTYGFVQINGNEVPIAAVEPATGVQVALAAGALVTLASLAGIAGSLTGS